MYETTLQNKMKSFAQSTMKSPFFFTELTVLPPKMFFEREKAIISVNLEDASANGRAVAGHRREKSVHIIKLRQELLTKGRLRLRVI